MSQQIIAAPVNGLLSNDMPPICRQRLDHIGNGSRIGSQRQSCRSSFQSRNPLFQYFLGRICKSAVDISFFLQTESCSRRR